jgi:D-aspartate ligase
VRPVREVAQGVHSQLAMKQSWALAIGDVSLVRALGRSNIPVMLASSETNPASLSRYCRGVVETPSFIDDAEGAVDALAEWAKRQEQRPVIFYQGDHDLLALSRYRDRIAPHAHLVLPDAELVEDLVDKLRFAELANKVGLPIPPTVALKRGDEFDLGAWAHFPCVVKPSTRGHWLGSALQMEDSKKPKAIRVETRADLDRVLPLVRQHETDCVLQRAIEGGEDQILSYHAYVRANGEVVAEFAGKKIRTTPRRYGFSTCLEIVDDPIVRLVGREIVRNLRFSGVLKIDFKRDLRDGNLYILEINPRFNLWHHLAAAAGMSIPALVYEDCINPGSAKIAGALTRRATWMKGRGDLKAFLEYHRAGEVSLTRWLRDVITADVNEDLFITDPLPCVADLVARVLRGARPRDGGAAR